MDRNIVSKTMKALLGECAFNWNGSFDNMVILSGQDKPSESDFTAKYNELNTAEPQGLRELREERDAKLAETDWLITMHKEKGTNIPTAWKTYRQALRDITDTYSDLDSVVWPTKPE